MSNSIVPQVENNLKVFHEEDDIIEIRVIGKTNYSGYFSNVELAAKEVQRFDGKGNVYFVFNKINAACYSRENRDRLFEKATNTSDNDIVRRQWIFIDFDPKRPSKTSATDDEKGYAEEVMKKAGAFLRAKGFSSPIIADSGNGWHLLYKIDMSNDSENKKIVETFLKSCDMLFSIDKVDVDVSVFNASRITKLYGTMAVKGANTTERPHRRSKITYKPDVVEITDVTKIKLISNMLPKPTARNTNTDFNLDDFMSKHNIGTSKISSWAGGKKYILSECPFDKAHGKDAAIIQLDSGALTFHCFHNGCAYNGWKELRELYEPLSELKEYKQPSINQQYEKTYEEWQPQNEKENAIDSWEIPLPFDTFILPKFPTSCLPSWVAEYVKAVSEETQTPEDMPAVATLGVLSIPCNKIYKIEGKTGWHEPTALYCSTIARPGERKSAIMSHVTRPLYDYEAEENERLSPDIARNATDKEILKKELEKLKEKAAKTGDREIRQEALEKAEELETFAEMKPLRLSADDVSPEKLTGLLADNDGRMAIISAEGGLFDTMAGRYSQSINIDVFLKAHAGDTLRVDRVGRIGEYIKEPALSLVLAIQPDVLTGVMQNSSFRGSI